MDSHVSSEVLLGPKLRTTGKSDHLTLPKDCTFSALQKSKGKTTFEITLICKQYRGPLIRSGIHPRVFLSLCYQFLCKGLQICLIFLFAGAFKYVLSFSLQGLLINLIFIFAGAFKYVLSFSLQGPWSGLGCVLPPKLAPARVWRARTGVFII